MYDPLILFQRIVRDIQLRKISESLFCVNILLILKYYEVLTILHVCSDNNSELAYGYKHFWSTTSHANILNPHPTFFS